MAEIPEVFRKLGMQHESTAGPENTLVLNAAENLDDFCSKQDSDIPTMDTSNNTTNLFENVDTLQVQNDRDDLDLNTLGQNQSNSSPKANHYLV